MTKKRGGITKTAVWILMGLLILGLGGFGVTNLSGVARSIGSVGTAEIDATAYARALQTEIRAMQAERGQPVSLAQAQAEQVDQAVLSRMISRAALEHETGRIGLSVGDETLRARIFDIPAFRGLDGKFDRTAYKFALEQAGMNEAQFEESIRMETASSLVQAAVMAGIEMPMGFTDTMMRFLAERRSLSYALLDASDLKNALAEPSEADLASFHETHQADFTTPEKKKIYYAWLTPSMIVASVDVDEAALREAYTAQAADFNQPERRLVERLVLADAEAAARARARIDDGVLLEMLVSERGLTMADIDLGDVSREDLGNAADAVFAAETGEIIGPIDTDLGPALFRVNAVLEAQNTPFEEAEPQLRETLAADRARRVVEGMIDQIEDLLAAGATLEDIAKETELEFGQIEWHADMSEEIAQYESFRKIAAEIGPKSYPSVTSLEDGGIFAARLDGVIEPRVQPLEEVRDRVIAGWTASATIRALRAQVEPEIARLEAGASFSDLGFRATDMTDITRRDYEPNAPAEFITEVFGMREGEVRLIEGDGRLYVLRLTSIKPPAEEDTELARLKQALRDRAASDFASDLFQVLADDIREKAGVKLDQGMINAVHANFN